MPSFDEVRVTDPCILFAFAVDICGDQTNLLFTSELIFPLKWVGKSQNTDKLLNLNKQEHVFIFSFFSMLGRETLQPTG